MKEARKQYSIAANIILLLWFTLDMIGITYDNGYLVTRSWKEDGIFWIIFLAVFLLYLFIENIGRIVLPIWLFLWLATQFASHEWFTIMGNGQGKISHFKGSLQWVSSDTRYIPDVYHTILHILILIALITTLVYLIQCRKRRNNNSNKTDRS